MSEACSPKMPNVIGWAATAASLTGVAIQALVPEMIGYSFFVFLGAALLWLANAVATGNAPMAFTQIVLIILNIIAILRGSY